MQAVEAPTKVPFTLTQDDGNITEADGTANLWSDLWKYQVPEGTGIILETGNTFACYLEDAAAEIGDDTGYVKIEHRDPSGQDKVNVFGAAIYLRVKDFQSQYKIAKLRLDKPVMVYPKQWLVVMAYDDGAIDASDSYFELKTSKVASPL